MVKHINVNQLFPSKKCLFKSISGGKIKDVVNFLKANEPRIELNREVTAPSGKKVNVRIAFGAEFFRPFF
jgi:hypothetical protein